METSVERFPPYYFDSNKSAFMKRTSRNMRRKRMSSKHHANNKEKYVKDKKSTICIIVINVISLILLGTILAIILTRSLQKQHKIICPYGYFGENCQKNDFIDYEEWASNTEMLTTAGGCYYGYSFRTWAPGAISVRLQVQDPVTDILTYYFMEEQKHGFWFVMICDLDIHSQYTYSINYRTESRYSLSPGSMERTLFSNREANIISDHNYIWNHSDFVSLPSNPIFYQINLPTYYEEQYSTSFETIINRLETIQLVGINVIELHALEQSSCDSEQDICWVEPSYSPGLLRPTLGTPKQLKQLIDHIHQLNMSVVLDLNWEFFNINSPIYHYHQFYTLYKTESEGEPIYSDVFRDSATCGAKCSLNVADNEFILLLLRSVLHRYRDEFHIDGIRWINNDCDSYIGGFCQSGADYNYAFELAIQSVWEDVRSEGFTIIRDTQSIVPDYDFFIDESLCTLIQGVSASTGIVYSFLKSFILTVNTSDPNVLFSLECFRSLENRLLIRTNYNIASIILSLFYLLPRNIHLFMGTPFLSDISFSRSPQTLDISEVGVYVDGLWQNPRKKFMKIQLSVDLNEIRDLYLTDGFEGIFIEYDNNNDKIVLRLGTYPNTLLIVINYGTTQYIETPFTFSISSMLPFNKQGTWNLLFSTSNSKYDSEAVTIESSMTASGCLGPGGYVIVGCVTYSVPMSKQSLSVFIHT